MLNKEVTGGLKSLNGSDKILEEIEYSMKTYQISQHDFDLYFFQNLFEQLAFTCMSQKNLSKSFIDSIIRSLQKLQSLYNSIPLHQEIVKFYNKIGKGLKKLARFDLAFEYYAQAAKLGKKLGLLDYVLVNVFLSICKLLNKQKKFTEALAAAKEAANIIQDLIISSKPLSNHRLLVLTCKSYYQIALQEQCLSNIDKSLQWLHKAERFLLKIPSVPTKLSEKIAKTLKKLTTTKLILSTFNPGSKSSRNFSEYFNVKNTNKGFTTKINHYPNPQGLFTSSSSKFLVNKVKESPQGPSTSFKRTERTYGPIKTSKQSPRKKIDAEKYKIEKSLLDVTSSFKSPITVVENPDIDTMLTRRVNKTNAECQTERLLRKNKTEKLTSTEDLLEISMTVLEQKVFGKTLVKSSKIDIKFEEFDINYYLNQTFDKLLIVLTNGLTSYDLEIDFDSDLPILDLIIKDLQPGIDLENNKLVFKKVTFSPLSTAILIKEDFQFTLQIQLKDPRAEILVNIVQDRFSSSQTFRISEIFPGIHSSLKTAELLSLCFDLHQSEVKLTQPLSHQLELLYYNLHGFKGLPHFHMKISKAVYADNTRYMFQPVPALHFHSLIIDAKALSRLSGVPIELLDLNIGNIMKLVRIKSSEITIEYGEVYIEYPVEDRLTSSQGNEASTELNEAAIKAQSIYKGCLARRSIEKDVDYFAEITLAGKKIGLTLTDSTLQRQLKIEANYQNRSFYLVLKYPIPFRQPFIQTIPPLIKIKYRDLVLKKTGDSNGYLFRNSLEQARLYTNAEIYYGFEEEELIDREIPKEIYNKIIFRTCLKKNGLMYIISMIINKSEKGEDVLLFFVRNGPLDENSQRFVIDLNTVCKKSGLPKTQLVYIGKFVVQHMITFVGEEVSFLNFSEQESIYEKHLVRLQAFFRGVLTRRRLRHKHKKVILKTFLNCAGRRWICLFKSDAVDLFFNMVSKTDVFSTKLNLTKISNENPYPSLKVFFRNRILPKIEVEVEKNGVKVTGIENYQIS